MSVWGRMERRSLSNLKNYMGVAADVKKPYTNFMFGRACGDPGTVKAG